MSKYLELKREKDLDLVRRMYIHHHGGSVSNIQLEQMLHAIGADNKKARSYLGKLTYHAYRNYYDAGGADIELWDDLVSRDYADHHGHFYHVSVGGLRLLEIMTGATIYGNYHTVGDCKVKMLKTIMEHECACTSGSWVPVSAKSLARQLKLPVELARKTAKFLTENGFIVKDHYGGMDEDGQVFCYHGYCLTDKARELEVYEEIQKAEYSYINRMLKGEFDGEV